MTDKEKFEKLKKLADEMYYAAQHLTTDASRLHKAMDEYHKFIIHECKEEPVSEQKLSNVGRIGKNWKEPVSEIDFEQELYKAFGQVKDFTLGMRIAKRFYEMGRNHQEPVSEDLLKELKGIVNIRECVSHGVPVIKIARHFANWQKEQLLANAVDVTIAIPYPNGYGGYTQLVDSNKALPFGENLKVLVIKED